MDFYSKKYTVLMNNEPIEVWIKNDKLKKAKFMDKEVDLSGLSKETLAQIQDNPTKVVNGNNLVENANFTTNFSKTLDAQLKIAIEKRDMQTLSRFARSDLVPEGSKKDFYEAINRPRGIRGLVVNTLNKVNTKIQKLAQGIDNFFVNQRESLANNEKLDKYLSSYQLKEFDKVPSINGLNLDKPVDAQLQQLASNFVKSKNIQELSDENMEDKILQDEFLRQAVRNGHSVDDGKVALFKEVGKVKEQQEKVEKAATISNQSNLMTEMQRTIDRLESQNENYKLKEASKNETLADFKTLTSKMDAVEKVDLLTANKEYMNMSEEQKLETEEKLLYSSINEQEQTKDTSLKAQAEQTKELENGVKEIQKELNEPQAKPIVKKELNDHWKVAQAQNRNSEIPTQKFMNLSAVKFDGVSEKSLNNWAQQMDEMREKGKNVPSQEKVDQFIQGTLKNAERLADQGILVQTSMNEFKFHDQAAKEFLYNQELQKEQSHELKDSLKEIASAKAFEKIIDASGNIDIDRLQDYAAKISEVSTQLQVAAKSNEVEVTKEDLQNLNKSVEQSQSQSQGRGRA